MRYIYIFLWAWHRTWKYICEKERIEFISAKCWYNIVQHIFDLSLTHILPKTSVQCVIVAHERVSAREKPTQSWWECRAANSVKLCSPWKSSSSDRRWKILFKVFLRYLLATLAHRVYIIFSSLRFLTTFLNQFRAVIVAPKRSVERVCWLHTRRRRVRLGICERLKREKKEVCAGIELWWILETCFQKKHL